MNFFFLYRKNCFGRKVSEIKKNVNFGQTHPWDPQWSGLKGFTSIRPLTGVRSSQNFDSFNSAPFEVGVSWECSRVLGTSLTNLSSMFVSANLFFVHVFSLVGVISRSLRVV